jgi:hypothetical protein
MERPRPRSGIGRGLARTALCSSGETRSLSHEDQLESQRLSGLCSPVMIPETKRTAVSGTLPSSACPTTRGLCTTMTVGTSRPCR